MGLVKLATKYIKNQYIIVAIDYTTKWLKVKALQDNMAKSIN
jgi:hypothetical protein